jgi:NAD(P) transhydrogenase subunit alpha
MLAVISATINVVGGFMVTDRMLEMFKREKKSEGDKA